jgi:hypothetical protein
MDDADGRGATLLKKTIEKVEQIAEKKKLCIDKSDDDGTTDVRRVDDGQTPPVPPPHMTHDIFLRCVQGHVRFSTNGHRTLCCCHMMLGISFRLFINLA